jgi:acetamidase/formamidase
MGHPAEGEGDGKGDQGDGEVQMDAVEAGKKPGTPQGVTTGSDHAKSAKNPIYPLVN